MFVHLHVHSQYSFLDGGSTLEQLVRGAAGFGMPALALTDHNGVYAAVKFSRCCQAFGIRPILGAEVTMADETHLTLLAQDRAGYANLCSLLTLGYTHGGRLTPHLPWDVLADFTPGLFCLSGCRKGLIADRVRRRQYSKAMAAAMRLRDWFGHENFFLELQDDFMPDSLRISHEIAELATQMNVQTVVTNNVHYLTPDDALTHDLLRCVAAGVTVADVHPFRPLNGERYLKSPREMTELFAWAPEAIQNSMRIAERCASVLPENEEITPKFAGGDASAILRQCADAGARERYGQITRQIKARLQEELSLICQLGFADYFLMVRDIARWTRAHGIRCTGRGSASDSCVAYCLYLTDVDVIARNLPFARFLVPGKTPDIDMDFPSDRRDEVFQHIIHEYGADRAAMVCTFHTYYAKGAIRDLGKALALPADVLSFLARHVSHFVPAHEIEAAFDNYAELKPHRALRERFSTLFGLCKRISGFPRHLGTHSSGMVISRMPLATIAPLQPSARGLTQIWTLDKDDAEDVGAIKFDILGLRMLSAVADAETDILKTHESFDYDGIPFDDTPTYNMIQSGKAVGTFQFESPAQMALATTLLPTHFEDLVAAVALIRPGPIRGNVVGRFVSARNGWTRSDVMHPALSEVLEKTYGCIVFQEQVVQVVAVLTGCTDGEADKFRKRITLHAKQGTLQEAREDFVTRACSNYRDLSPKRANIIFDQIEGWSGYGFIEGHAASFALTGYRTAYLSVHHAAEFYAGMMNNQPMGFYNSNSLASEARRRGVTILPVDINESDDKCCAVEGGIRLGFRLIAELRKDDIETIVAARSGGPFRSLLDFCIRVPLHRDRLENLVLAGVFDRLHGHRRGLLFGLEETLGMALSYRAAQSDRGRLALALDLPEAARTPVMEDIADFTPWERFVWTWRIAGVTAECHVFSHFRERLQERGFLSAYDAQQCKHGEKVRVAGLNIRPHRPHTSSGKPVLFASVEDETDLIHLGCFGEAIDRCTGTFLCSHAIMVEGIVKRRGRGTSLVVTRVRPFEARVLDGPRPGMGNRPSGSWRAAEAPVAQIT